MTSSHRDGTRQMGYLVGGMVQLKGCMGHVVSKMA